jgi:hypothetical protein
MATLVPTTLQVRRRFEPAGNMSPWEQSSVDALVWVFDGTVARVPSIPHLPDYVPGLLTCYINERKVDLGLFATALQAICGMTLGDLEHAIAVHQSADAGTPIPRA